MERIVYEAFILCDLDAVGRLGLERVGYTKLVERCVKRTKSEDDIHSGERAGRPWKQDVCLGAQDEVGYFRALGGLRVAW